jgi:hypothetical protein
MVGDGSTKSKIMAEAGSSPVSDGVCRALKFFCLAGTAE